MKANFTLLSSLFSLIFLLGINSITIAQLSKKGEPANFKAQLEQAAVIQLPQVDVQQLLAEDAQDRIDQVPARFAKVFNVDYSLNNSGTWTTLKNGERVWRLAIQSDGAYSLNVIFKNFRLPQGAELFLYNKDKSHILGAFTAANNKESGIFAVSPVKGDHLIIEYKEPAKAAFSANLTVERIGHDYKDIFKTIANEKSGNCNVDINCTAGNNWQVDKRAVAHLILSGGFVCSGALVNNTNLDGTPYFLTANHCVATQTQAQAVVFVFNYERPNCGSGTAPTNQTISGSDLRATDDDMDFALLELATAPPPAFNAYFAGWNTSTTAPNGGTGIHHPDGDSKKICVENQALTSTDYDSATPNTAADFWRVADWDVGVTEGGSSGSPLFDANHRIVAYLSGGYAACSGTNDNGLADWYGKFCNAWDKRTGTNQQLEAWLAPNSTATTLDGREAENLCGTDNYEPNNTIAEAEYLGSSTSYAIAGLCITPNDNDFFEIYADGQYYQIRVAGYSGNVVGQYNLRVTNDGANLTIETEAINGSNTDTYLYLYGGSQSVYLDSNDDSNGTVFSKIVYELPTACTSDAYESNNTMPTATTIAGPTTLNTLCLTPGDYDYFEISPSWDYYILVEGYSGTTKGQYKLTYTKSSFPINDEYTVTIETKPEITGFTVDTKLYLYASDGFTQIAFNDDIGGGNLFSRIVVNVPAYVFNPIAEEENEAKTMRIVSEEKDAIQANTISNFPNPFAEETTIAFTLSQEEKVSLTVYDITGKKVTQLLDNEFKTQGAHQVQFNANQLPTGMYFYTINAGQWQETGRMILNGK